MSSGDLRQDASEYNQDSSDSDVESQNSSCIQGNPKRVDKASACWKFRDIIQADFPGSSFGERKQRLIEHFRTRTSSERPSSVRSVTIFADLGQIVLDASDETRHDTISITIIAEKSDRKVCVFFNHLDFSTFSLFVTGFRVQRLAANEQAGKQA